MCCHDCNCNRREFVQGALAAAAAGTLVAADVRRGFRLGVRGVERNAVGPGEAVFHRRRSRCGCCRS